MSTTSSAKGPRRGRRDPRRREQLLTAFDTAVAEHGPGVTMDDIAGTAGVTKPILYRHFGDKGGLYEALVDRYVQDLMARLETGLADDATPQQRTAATIDAFLTALEERPEVYRFLLYRAAAERPEVSQAVNDFTQRLGSRLADVIVEEYASAGLTVRDSGFVAAAMIGMVQNVGQWWLATSEELTREGLVQRLTTLLWAGLPALGERA